jgi:hypothetical protein
MVFGKPEQSVCRKQYQRVRNSVLTSFSGEENAVSLHAAFASLTG